MDAVEAAPVYSMKRFVIHIKKGVYTENVVIKKKKWNLVVIGEGMDVTIISANLILLKLVLLMLIQIPLKWNLTKMTR